MTYSSGAKVRASDFGWLAEVNRVSFSANFTTTELIADTITFTALAVARYKITLTQWVQSSVSGDGIEIRFRYQAGASLTAVGGTMYAGWQAKMGAANICQPIPAVLSIPPGTLPAGQVTIGIGGIRSSGIGGSGNHQFAGATNIYNCFMLERVS